MSVKRDQSGAESGIAAAPTAEAVQWQQFFASKDAALRLQLIDHYLPFARMLAAKLYARRQGLDAPFEDYLHNATVALIQAIDRYDPKLGASFQTYAHYRIEGTILNELPRLSEQHAQVGMLTRLRRERLESLSNHQAKSAKAKAKGSLFEDMVELAVGLSIGYMLEDTGMYSNDNQIEERDGYSIHALKQLGGLMQKLVEILPEKEKTVIKHHYFFGLGMEEIAQHMQLSKGRVSQLHKQGLKELKKMAETVGLNLNL